MLVVLGLDADDPESLVQFLRADASLRFDKENLVGDDVHGLAVATRALHETLHARAERLALLLDGRRTPDGRRPEEDRCT